MQHFVIRIMNKIMYDPIEGFEYEQGYEYVIEVKIEHIENPPADGSSLKYSLIRVISKTKKNSEGLPEQKPLDNQFHKILFILKKQKSRVRTTNHS
ncbi:DUF4377 domain-containing protein [Parabacteroides faecis]|uniref:DUF4377 domain-containing protein n=2 Tax=Parabacteroides TaxID=375288 RepID=UPI000F00A578|nr:DUF4377 domain-containing protein [Parabacteroides faecis]RHR92562.1 DUF4377 domain-containing protein [Parabacteroides sp. AF14-59]